MIIKEIENPMTADRIRWEHIQRVMNRNVSETARRLRMQRYY